MEGAANYIHLLFPREADKVHRVAGHPDRELRVLLRVFHRVLERVLGENIEVHVEAALTEIHVEGFDRAIDQFLV